MKNKFELVTSLQSPIYNHRAALLAYDISEHKEPQLWRIVFGVLNFVALFKLSGPSVITFRLGLGLNKRGAALTLILPLDIQVGEGQG